MAFVSNDVPTAFANAVAAGAVTCKHPQKNLGGKWSLSGGNNDFFNTIDPKQTQRMSAFESKSHDRVMYI